MGSLPGSGCDLFSRRQSTGITIPAYDFPHQTVVEQSRSTTLEQLGLMPSAVQPDEHSCVA